MKKTLPLGAIVAQKKTRTNKQLKELLFLTLKELSVLSPEEKVKYVREKVDYYLSQMDTTHISCYNGCAHCCHHLIHCSKSEVLDMPELKGAQLNQNLTQKDHLDAGREWNLLEKKNRACVYLGSDNSCSIYELRPLVCRITHVTSPNDHCDLETELDIEPYFEDKANTVVLAYYTLEENFQFPYLVK